MITITDKAKTKLDSLKNESNFDITYFVRIGVEGGGCSGISYKLDFDNKLNSDDKQFEDNGIVIVINKKSLLYLIGTELDFSDGLNGKGFIYNNPNSTRNCGCGQSFSV